MIAPTPTRNPLHLLLVFVVLAPLASVAHAAPTIVFACAALAIIPLAGLMGDATERLGARLGAGPSGLLNATFGNAAELILALVALRAGRIEMVKASITGSILGNALLVLGLAMVAGGARRERQVFDRTAASAAATLFTLSAIGLVVPAAFHVITQLEGGATHLGGGTAEHDLSLLLAIVLAVAYLLSLLFSLHTHRHLYTGGAEGHAVEAGSTRRALVTLLMATALVAWMSELLIGSVEVASHALGLGELFVGVVVVALIGNAAEHSTAVTMAMRDQMDLALHIAIGSSLQIALFVAPVLVFASHLIAPVPMDLRFTPFEVVAVVAAVAIVNRVADDGESNWLEGALLLAVWVLLAVAFYFLG